MPQVLVWKCSHTGKLFEDEEKYREHLKREARHRLLQRKLHIEERDAAKWFHKLQETEFDIKTLPAIVLKNQDKFWAEARRFKGGDNWSEWSKVGRILTYGKSRSRKVHIPIPKLLTLDMDFRFQMIVSNSHDCPHNGITNWEGDASKPRGYPGWSGRVAWTVQWPEELNGLHLAGDIFESPLTRINTGSGGGTSAGPEQKYGYDFKVFAADWPGPYRFHEKKFVWNKVGGNPADVPSVQVA